MYITRRLHHGERVDLADERSAKNLRHHKELDFGKREKMAVDFRGKQIGSVAHEGG